MRLYKVVLLLLVLLSFASAAFAQENRAVAPLIQPVWHQTDPWNGRCPGPVGSRAHAGSHALALAKLMKYWAYPTYGVGTVSYTDDDYGVLTQDLTPEIMWNNMSNDLIFQTTLRYIYKVGVAIHTNYELDYSTATLANVQTALLNNFTYNSGMTYRNRAGTTNFYWKSLVRAELDAHRPVLYAATLADGNEVAFIIDGYNDEGLFHINWSDASYPNDYVDLNTLSVHGETITTANQHMLTGVKPSEGPANVDESFETDFSNFNWQFNGNANWTISTESAFFGSQSAKSGNIMDNQSTSMFIQINVTNADTISFYKKVSCEVQANNLYDHLAFFIDDVEQERWSGDGSWAYHEYPVTSGVHTFRWTYVKDGASDYFSDCGWVDGIDLPEGTTPLNPARFVEAEVLNSNDIQVNWAIPEGNLTNLLGYRIYRNGTQIVQYSNPQMTAHVDNNMPNGNYTYYVRAVYQQGLAGLSNTASAFVEVPYAPVNLTATLVGVNNVGLTWQAPPLLRDRAMMGYQIYRDNVMIAQVENPEATTYQDPGLNEGVYYYEITAIYNAGESVRSNVAQVAVGVPDPPSNLRAIVTGDDVALSWNQVPNVTFLQGFKVYRNGVMVHQVTSPTQLQYTDQNLLNGSYAYYVRAVYTGEDSGNSATVNVTVEVPYAPTNPTATVTNDINVQLRWTNPQATRTLTQYRVYRDGQLIAAIFNPSIVAYLDQNLPNALYTYTITAIYSGVESPQSAPVTALIEVLYPPTNLTASVTLADVQLNWTIPVNQGGLTRSFNGYNVYRNNVLRAFVSGSTNHSYRDINVPNGVYRYDVAAVYTTGISTLVTVPSILVEVLYPPTGLTYNIVDDDVTLNWVAAATQPSGRDSGSRAFITYNVYRNSVLYNSTTNTTFTDANLNNGIYHYYVKASYTTGESIPTSTVNPEVEVPYPPRNLVASLTDDDVRLSWEAPVNSGGLTRAFVNYQVYRNNTLIQTTTSLTYNDTGLVNNTYQYYVKAVYQNHISAPSNTQTVLVEILYPARNLVYAVQTRNSVVLNWTAPATSGGLRNLTGYQVYRNNNLLNTTTNLTYTDPTLANGTYNYFVKAVYGTGPALASNAVTARIEYPYPPTNVAAVVSGDDVTLTWNAVPGTTTGYKLYRNNVLVTTVAGLTYTDANLANGAYQYYLISVNASDSGPSDPSTTVTANVEVLYPATNLTFTVSNDDVTLRWTAAASSGGLRSFLNYTVFKDNVQIGQTTALTLSDLNLANGIYHYYVVANYTTGASAHSNTVDALVEVLYPPSLLTRSVSVDNVTLSWTAALTSGGLRNFQGYRVFRNGTAIALVPGTTYQDTGLANGIYSYYVVAVYSSGVSTPTNTVSATVEVAYPPSNLAYAIDDDNVILTWNAAPTSGGLRSFLGYKVYRNNAQIAQVTSLTYTDASLTNGIYDYKVTAVYSSGESTPSNIVHVDLEVFYPARNLTGTVNTDDVTLSWNAAAVSGGLRSFTGYKIYRDNVLINQTTALTYLDANLANATYSYHIVAAYLGGDAAPTNDISLLVEVPYPASNLTCFVNSDAVTLNWMAAPTSGRSFLGYSVYRDDALITETTNLTYTDLALANGSYSYYVIARYGTGNSVPTNTVTALVEVLYPASNLTYNVSDDEVILHWNAAPTSGGLRSFLGYAIYRNNTQISQTMTLTYNDQNMINGTYHYYVQAMYSSGSSTPTNTVDVLVEVLYPATALTSNVVSDDVHLAWNAAAVSGGLRDFQGYKVYRDGAEIIQTMDLTYLDTNLANGVYTYYVTAIYGSGVSTPTNTVTATVEVLYPPANLTCVNNDDAVVMTWTAAPTSGGLRSFIGYKVYRDNAVITQTTNLAYTDNALTNGIYDYKVTAVYSSGESLPSNIVHIEVEVLYPATNLTYSVSTDEVTLHWNAAVVSGGLRSFTGYKIYRNNSQIAQTTSLTYLDADLANGIYTYFVVAAYQGGDATPTPSVEALVEVLYPASNLMSEVYSDAVTLSWSAAPTSGRSFLGYKLYRDNALLAETASLSYTDLALANGMYAYYVIAHYGTGDSAPTPVVTATVEVLYPASNLTGSVAGDDVTLTWVAAVSTGGLRNLLGYNIYRNNVQIGQTTALIFADQNLANGNYRYTVAANYTSGISYYSNSVDLLVEVPYPATNLTYTTNGDEVTLAWNAAATSARSFVGYTVYQDNVEVAQTTFTSYTLTDLANGMYSFYVIANYSTGNSVPTNTVQVTVEVLHPATNLIYSVNGDDVSLSWTAAAGLPRSFVGYRIYRNDALIATVNTLNYVDNNLANGAYHYYITALYSGGESIATNTINLSVEIPYPVTTLTAEVVEDNVTLRWSVPAIGAQRSFQGYFIYRNNSLYTVINTPASTSWSDHGLANGNYTYSMTAVYDAGLSIASNVVNVTINLNPDLNPPVALTATISGERDVVLTWQAPVGNVLSYKVYRDAVQIAWISATTMTDLARPNGSYNYYVKAVYASGMSSASNTVTANVMIANAPGNFNAQILLGNNVMLSWSTPNLGEIGYIIYRNGTELAYVPDNDITNYQDQNLGNGIYSYYMKAVYLSVISVPTNTVSVAMIQSYAPHNLVVNVNQSQVNLVWEQPEDLGGFVTYRIYRNSVNYMETTQPTFTDLNVPNGTYNYYVTSVYNAGESYPTNISTVAVQVIYAPAALVANTLESSVNLSWTPVQDLVGFLRYKIWRNDAFIGVSATPAYQDMLLANGVYQYYVTAEYLNGMSGATNTASVQVKKAYAPQNATVVRTANNVTITWSAPVDTGYMTGYRLTRNGVTLTDTALMTYSDVNLINSNYTYEVSALYGELVSPAAAAGFVHIEEIYPPQNPAVAYNNNTVLFSWAAPQDSGFLAHYKVYLDNILIGTTTGLTYSQSGLVNGTYSYQVSAQYSANESPRTNPVIAVVENQNPAASLVCNLNANVVTLYWNATVSSRDLRSFQGYKVYRNGVLINQVTTTMYTDPGLANGTYQYYIVASYTSGDASPSNTVTAEVEVLYPATNLTCFVSYQNVVLNWSVPATSAGRRSLTNYHIYRNDTMIAETNNLSYSQLALSNGSYTYYVTAHYSSGESAPSNTVMALVQVAYAPVNLTQVTEQNQVTLNWLAPVDIIGLSQYQIFRDGIVIAQTNNRSFVNTLVLNGTHVYKIGALYVNGQIAYSSEVSTTINLAFAPQNLAATVNGSHVTLSWSAPEQVQGLTSYKIFRNNALINTQAGLNYTDLAVANGNYTYYVTALFGTNESAPTPTVFAHIAVTYPARDVNASFQTGTATAVINWTAPLGGMPSNGYNVYFLQPSQQNNPASWIVVAQGVGNTTSIDAYHGGMTHGSFMWAVVARYDNGNSPAAFSNILVNTGNDDNEQTAVTRLIGNYPNPFNPQTSISFSLKESMPVQLLVYNSKGQVVKTLVSSKLDSGTHSIAWKGDSDNGQALSSGIYFYRLITPDYTKTGKAIMKK